MTVSLLSSEGLDLPRFGFCRPYQLSSDNDIYRNHWIPFHGLCEIGKDVHYAGREAVGCSGFPIYVPTLIDRSQGTQHFSVFLRVFPPPVCHTNLEGMLDANPSSHNVISSVLYRLVRTSMTCAAAVTVPYP